jgi:hypothetical protein
MVASARGCIGLTWLFPFALASYLGFYPASADSPNPSSATDFVSGIVTDVDGQPVGAVEISVSQRILSEKRYHRETTRTGRDGTFRIPVLPERDVSLRCNVPEGHRVLAPWRWVSPGTEKIRFIVREDTGNDADFPPLKQDIVVTGRVTDPSGEPVAGTRVGGLGSRPDTDIVTQEDGTFEFRQQDEARWVGQYGCSPGLILAFYHAERCLGNSRRVSFTGEWEYELDIPLVPLRSATGEVIDEKGEPVAGITVLWKHPFQAGRRRKWTQAAVTDQNGRYTVDSLIPGLGIPFCALNDEYATPPGGYSVRSWNQSTDTISTIEVFARNLALEGIVLESGDTPVRDGTVTVEPFHGDLYETLTDEHGRFRFSGLVAGELEVRAWKPDNGSMGPDSLHGSVKCHAGDTGVKLEVHPLGCMW